MSNRDKVNSFRFPFSSGRPGSRKFEVRVGEWGDKLSIHPFFCLCYPLYCSVLTCLVFYGWYYPVFFDSYTKEEDNAETYGCWADRAGKICSSNETMLKKRKLSKTRRWILINTIFKGVSTSLFKILYINLKLKNKLEIFTVKEKIHFKWKKFHHNVFIRTEATKYAV